MAQTPTYTLIKGTPHMECVVCGKLTPVWGSGGVLVGRLQGASSYSWNNTDKIQQFRDFQLPKVRMEASCVECYTTWDYTKGKYKGKGMKLELANGLMVHFDTVFFNESTIERLRSKI